MSKIAPKSGLKAKATKLVSRYFKNTSGSIAPMFGLAAIPFVLAAGAAIDMSRINREQSALYNALDNAALAIAADIRSEISEMSASQKEIRRVKLEKLAKKFVKANYKDISDGVQLDVDLELRDNEVDITGTLELPMSFMQLAGVDSVTLTEKSTVRRGGKAVEVALVLDTTGSMKNDMGSLKTAAGTLLSTLYQDESPTNKTPYHERIRVSLVPFSSAVRLDTNAYDFSMGWIDTTGLNPLSTMNFNPPTLNNFTAWGAMRVGTSTTNHTWNGCVEARQQSVLGANLITSDTPPAITNPNSLFPAFFNPDSPTWFAGSGTIGSNNFTRQSYYDAGGTFRSSGNWGNNFIPAAVNYNPTLDTSTTLGANSNGYDDSGIGNNNKGFDARYKNTNKYTNAQVPVETFTPSGATWNVNPGPWVGCTASKVVPMTHDRSKIDNGVNAMKAYGATNIAEGVAWGMRTISPGAPFQLVEGAGPIANNTIAPYGHQTWRKIVVLMSDGENDPCTGCNYTDTNAAYNANGRLDVPLGTGLNRYNTVTESEITPRMDTYTLDVCNNLKAQGVTIYTIGFRLDNPKLKACASSDNHYKYAPTPEVLVTLFEQIGEQILNQMLYVAK